jgi:hypothetical protein
VIAPRPMSRYEQEACREGWAEAGREAALRDVCDLPELIGHAEERAERSARGPARWPRAYDPGCLHRLRSAMSERAATRDPAEERGG